MAKEKKSFLIYADLIHTVSKMPKEKAGELLMHILEYVNDMNPQTDDLIIQLTFEPIKQQLKRDLVKYEKVREKNKENARKRWDAVASDGMRVDTKNADNDNDNDNVKDIINNIIDYINTTLNKKFRFNDKLRKQYNARLKEGYTEADIKRAIDNAIADQFHKDSKYKYLTPEFFSRMDKLERWCNSVTQEQSQNILIKQKEDLAKNF